MPRYFFHIRNFGQLIRDEEGTECADLEAMEWEARQSARDLIAQRLKAGGKLNGDLIEVCDASGSAVFAVKFSDLLM